MIFFKQQKRIDENSAWWTFYLSLSQLVITSILKIDYDVDTSDFFMHYKIYIQCYL